jgi:hypothetical protein
MPDTKNVDVRGHVSNASQTAKVSAYENRRKKERQMRKIIAALQVSVEGFIFRGQLAQIIYGTLSDRYGQLLPATTTESGAQMLLKSVTQQCPNSREMNNENR